VLYAIGNSGQADLVPTAQGLVGDPDPTIVEAAQWAIEQLAGK